MLPKKYKLPLAIIWLFASMIYAGQSFAEDISTILTGKVIPTVIRPVPMPFNAVVDKLLVKPGQQVEEGTPLLQFHLQDEARRMLQTEINIGAGTEELKGQILDLKRELSTVGAERNKTRHLVSSGLGSKQALGRLEETVEALKARISLLQATVAKNENNFASRIKELDEYFGVSLKEGETLPENLMLTSPIKGYVLSVAPALNPGQLMGAGSSPIQVGQLNPVSIQIPVYEAEINHIQVGDTARVEIPSLGNRTFKGIVHEISWISSDMNVSTPSYYTVELTVPNPDLLLKPGFKAVVHFDGGRSRK